MLYRQVVGGLTAIVLSVSPAFGQSASIPTEESYLKYSDSKTLEVMRKLKEKAAVNYKGFLEKYLKCDGQNGNAEMTMEYSDPDSYFIDSEGKCTYVSHGGN